VNEKRKVTRRRFLALAGGAIGVTGLACCGLTALGMQQPEVEFVESSCGGENGMSKKVLVAYASKCGSTGEVAEAIGQTLCADGVAVDVRLAKEVTDVSDYQAVVAGSAIRMGQWLPDAVKFVETYRGALSQIPVAYFAVCMTLSEDTEENRREVAGYLDPVRELLQPVDAASPPYCSKGVGLFAGAIDYGKLSLPLRLMIKAMKVPEGDFRDWDAIRDWAAGVRPLLLSV
jgi:menaquinone-dependent protoporphyrinogen oxidase